MTMKTTDSLIAAPRGNASQAISYFRRLGSQRMDDVIDYVNAVFELAPKVGIDPSIVIAQASHETGGFTSYWWVQRLNPAGIGITGDPTQNNASRTFKTGREAAKAQIAHLLLYATGKISAPLSNDDDPRYQAYHDAYGNGARAKNIMELTNKWAVDDKYHIGIVRHGNTIFPDLPNSQAQSVPTPPAQETNEPQPSDPKPSEPPPTTSSASVVKDANGKSWDGLTNLRVNDILFRAAKRSVTVKVDGLNARKYANVDNKISPVIKMYDYGDEIEVLGWTKGARVNNEDRWWITSDYLRVWVGGTSQKPL